MAKRTDEDILVHEDQSNELFGTVMWEAGNSLAKFFTWEASIGSSMQKNSVLELGAGTGVVGLTLGRLGKIVTVTDNEAPILDLLQRNIAANGLNSFVSVRRVDWSDTHTYLNPDSFDMVVAADVLYLDTALDFLQALKAHMSPRCVAYISYECRNEESFEFFIKALQQGLRIDQLQDGDGKAVGSAAGQQPKVFKDSRFVSLDADGIVSAVRDALFNELNSDRVQIFRITWAITSSEVLGEAGSARTPLARLCRVCRQLCHACFDLKLFALSPVFAASDNLSISRQSMFSLQSLLVVFPLLSQICQLEAVFRMDYDDDDGVGEPKPDDYDERMALYDLAPREIVQEVGRQEECVWIDLRPSIFQATEPLTKRDIVQHEFTPEDGEEFKAHMSETLPEDKRVPILLFDNSGRSGVEAKKALQELGYNNVVNAGGYADVVELATSLSRSGGWS